MIRNLSEGLSNNCDYGTAKGCLDEILCDKMTDKELKGKSPKSFLKVCNVSWFEKKLNTI